MKKIISILIALVTIAGVADAQITVRKSEAEVPQKLTTLSMYWSWIYSQNDSYYLVMNSTNEFDNNFWLKIGSNKEECLESLSSLLELFDTMEETDRFDIGNGEGESFSVTMGRELGIEKLIFHGEGYAGTGFLYASNISKAEKWIEKNMK